MSFTLFMPLLTIAMTAIAVVEYRDKNRSAALGWAVCAAGALFAFFQQLSNLLKYMS